MNIRISACLLLLLAAGTSYCQSGKIVANEIYTHTKSEKANKYYNEGHDATEARNFKKAIEYYKLAIAEDPDYIDAYDNAGVAFRQLDMLDSAALYYLISIKKYPKGTVARGNMAVVEEMRGNPEKALAYYNECLAIDNKDPETYYGLMRVYGKLQKFDEALASGNKAEQLYFQRNDPYIGDCYYMLCITHIMMNNKEKARLYATKAESKGVKLDKAITDALK